MGNISARQVAKTRSIYHDPSIRQALQQRRFATAQKPQAPDPQLRVALQQRYGELALQKKPQDFRIRGFPRRCLLLLVASAAVASQIFGISESPR